MTWLAFMLSIFSATAHAQNKSSLTPQEQALLYKDLGGVVRGFIWGLPQTAILENETGTFMEEEDGALFYVDYIRQLKCTIAYDFKKNRLWRVRIVVEKTYHDQQERVQDLLKIQEDLTRRFGKPVTEDFKWLNNKEKRFPELWGWAAYRGELVMTSVFQDKETVVTTFLGAPKKFRPVLSVTYEDRAEKARMGAEKNIDPANNLLVTP